MSDFGSTSSHSSSKRRKLDDLGLPASSSTDSLVDTTSLESSHTSPPEDVLREDSSSAESLGSNSEAESSNSASVDEDDGSSFPEGSSRPFILPDEWEVNKHSSSLTKKKLVSIRSDFQIPHNVPLRLAKDGEKCYSPGGKGVGLYKEFFISGLRLPLNDLTWKLIRKLGICISQLAPNSWRVFVGAQILWGVMSEGQVPLSLDEFLYCYKPLPVPKSEGMYYFKCRKSDRKLVTEIPSSNRNWKDKFFFVLGSNLACNPEEVSITQPLDCTWGILPKSALTLPRLSTDQLRRIERALSYSTAERNWRVLITVDNLYRYHLGPEPSAAARRRERLAQRHMEAGAVKKNKKVQAAAVLAAAAIKDGKLKLPKPSSKRKFGAEQPSSPFGTIAHPKGSTEVPRLKDTAAPSSVVPPPIPEERPTGPGQGKGLFTPPKPRLLLEDASYAVEQVLSIVKEEDIDNCDEFTPASIGEAGLHDLAKAIVRMKTLELQCADYEHQAIKFRKRAKDNGDALKELQESVASLQEKNAALEAKVKSLESINANQIDLILQAKGSNQQLSDDMEELKGKLAQAKAEAIAEHTSSSEYLQELGIQYVEGFEDFRTQALAAFPDLDFSKFEITVEEGSVATMASDGAEQGVDSAAMEKQGEEIDPKT